jgi:hypothetical protein
MSIRMNFHFHSPSKDPLFFFLHEVSDLREHCLLRRCLSTPPELQSAFEAQSPVQPDSKSLRVFVQVY